MDRCVIKVLELTVPIRQLTGLMSTDEDNYETYKMFVLKRMLNRTYLDCQSDRSQFLSLVGMVATVTSRIVFQVSTLSL